MLAALMTLAFFMAFNFNTPRTTGLAAGAFVFFALIFIYFVRKAPARPPQPAASSFPVAEAPLPSVQVEEAQPSPLPPAALGAAKAGAGPRPEVAYETIHNAPTVAVTPLRPDATLQVTPRPLACLTVLAGPDAGRRFEIVSDDILLGRDPIHTDIHLDDPTVSARHARILRQQGGFWLIDLNSTNGTAVNGTRIDRVEIYEGDTLQLGATRLRFSVLCEDAPAPAAAPESAPSPPTE